MCESDFYSSDFRIIHSRGETHQWGMAVVLDKRAAKTADKIQFDGDRVLMVRSRGKLTNSVLVRVHMPTSHHDDEETDEMHDKSF